MFSKEIKKQMEIGGIKNPHQLSQLSGIDSRTAYKAVNTDKYVTPRTIAKIAVVFGFDGYTDFRKHVLKLKKEMKK